MKILITGSGGREHAIAFSLSKNEYVEKIYCAPGNAGTYYENKCENVKLNGIDEFVSFAKEKNIDLTIVGSEDLLVEGIVDIFQKNNLKIFGPNKKGAMLEGSKAYAKDFMKKYGIKTALYQTFNDCNKAKEYLKNIDYPIVIKASGLALGKGVVICNNINEANKALEEMMIKKVFGEAGSEIVIEEFLEGYEASIRL